MRVGELSCFPPLPGRGMGEGKMPFSLPPLSQVGELSLPLSNCNTLESGPCTSPGQHSKADTVDRGIGELAMRT